MFTFYFILSSFLSCLSSLLSCIFTSDNIQLNFIAHSFLRRDRTIPSLANLWNNARDKIHKYQTTGPK